MEGDPLLAGRPRLNSMGVTSYRMLPKNPNLTDSPLLLSALVNGFGIVGIIYSLGPVSGAHVNPAVTVATMIAKQLKITEGIGYIVSQLAGGITGCAMVLIMHPSATDPQFFDMMKSRNGQLGLIKLGPEIVWQRALFCEIVLTFILVFTIFCVVLNPHVTVNDVSNNTIAPLFAPIAVGFTVLANVLAGTPISGACMNPARAIGPMLLTNTWDYGYVLSLFDIMVVLLGPIIGSIIAAVFQLIIFVALLACISYIFAST